MPDLILRPRIIHTDGAPVTKYALQLRFYESLGETEYYDIAVISLDVARDIVRSGAPSWLFGEPKEQENSDV